MQILRISTPFIAAGMMLTGLELHAEPTKTDTTTTRETTTRVKRVKHVDVRRDETVSDGRAGDNTGVNKRDRADSEVTADQQKNDKKDVELAAEIRRAVVKNKSLSMNAHNIKIIVQDGRVTLKGPVASKDEKTSVERIAAEIVGKGNDKVTSEIAVAP